MFRHVAEVRPDLVCVDPLRTFWPTAEHENRIAASVLRDMRKASSTTGCAWIIAHHLRKPDDKGPKVDLEAEPNRWLLQVCGARALVNHTALRLGFEEWSGNARLEAVARKHAADWSGLLKRHPAQGRSILAKLLRSKLEFNPEQYKGRRGVRFSAPASIVPLLTGLVPVFHERVRPQRALHPLCAAA